MKLMKYALFSITTVPDPQAQLVASPTADPGVASFIPAQSHTFVEIDHSPPSTDLIRVVVSYRRKYVPEVLVNCLVKLAKENCG